MSSAIDQAFSVHARAMQVYGRRAEILAANLANADTPHYKARDIDFRSILAQNTGVADVAMQATRPGHIPAVEASSETVQYRVPMQPSVDGNTVDGEVEQTRFAENTVYYQASVSFLGGTIKGLLAAIKGE